MSEKKTYGGLPVTDDYLERYGVTSDQEVYIAIACVIVAFVLLLGLAAVALLVWA